MNWAYVHLALNHVPVVGVPIACAMLALALWKKSAELRDGALVLMIVLGVFAAGAYLTGGPAEEVVEDLDGVSASAIEPHEEAALFAALATGLAALLALGVLVTGQRRAASRMMVAGTLVVALVAAIAMARTATLGGLIRHPEMRMTAP